jgi:hypothetical protein
MAGKPQRMMRQVQLSRPGPYRLEQGLGSELKDVAWIDNALAVPDKRVRDEDGNVWTVEKVYGAKLFADVDKQREAWKRWSDVLDKRAPRTESE